MSDTIAWIADAEAVRQDAKGELLRTYQALREQAMARIRVLEAIAIKDSRRAEKAEAENDRLNALRLADAEDFARLRADLAAALELLERACDLINDETYADPSWAEDYEAWKDQPPGGRGK